MKKILSLGLGLMTLLYSNAQVKPIEIPLYPDNKIPNEIAGPNEEKSQTQDGILIISKVRNPTLTIFLPEKNKANGTAVVICPGGGYSIVAAGHEGYDVAKRFNEMGVAAIVLKYRLPDSSTSTNPTIAPLQDVQQSFIVVRKNAQAWKINPDKVGLMGFSAGGHLASTGGTHFQAAVVSNPDQINLRPDFLILIYPVISSDPSISHAGSFEKLLGKNPDPEQLKKYSNELQVNSNTPPTFLVHATDDDVVNVKNSIVFYEALITNKVPVEIHIYEKGGHGFGLKNSTTKDDWFERCKNWMESYGFISNGSNKK
ncbi:MAG: hypothetical protein C5B52_12165 [Bacteroidetes bacterium]|nr:MAG: hypothetical protein C5B52_12165 [Bacteroidota bacterium]